MARSLVMFKTLLEGKALNYICELGWLKAPEMLHFRTVKE